MAATTTDIAIIGGGIGGMTAARQCRGSRTKVTLCMANPFLEIPYAGCDILVNPELHPKFVCPNPEDFKIKGVDYIFDVVQEIDVEAKIIRFASKPPLSYKAVIVASGRRLPLITPKPGDTLAQRIREVQKVAAAIDAADTIVVSGAGPIGIELAGDIRAKHPNKRVAMLSRDGEVLNRSHPPPWQDRIKAELIKRKIEVFCGSEGPLAQGINPLLTPGSIQLATGPLTLTGERTGDMLSYDVFLVAFAQGPNTEFLARSQALDDRGQIVVNNMLQSTKYPELFGVGVTSTPPDGHPASTMIAAQATACARNVRRFLRGRKLYPYTKKGLERPLNVKIGSGPGGYLIWDVDMLGWQGKYCCCLPYCGFPFCPPPCCWCGPGCSTCFGDCMGPTEGEGGALWVPGWLIPKTASSFGYRGMGKPFREDKPAQQAMSL